MFINKKYLLDLNISFLKNSSSLCFYTFTNIEYIMLPKFYYYSLMDNSISFIFFNKVAYKGLLSCILTKLKYFNLVKFIKFRIKGLGYEVRECTLNIHSFCFNWINYIYILSPLQIILRSYKKRFFIISRHWSIFRMVVDKILDLKRVGPYTLRGFRLLKAILLIKKSGKKV